MSQTLCQTLHALHHLFLIATYLQMRTVKFRAGGVGTQTQAILNSFTNAVTYSEFTSSLQWPQGSRQLAIWVNSQLPFIYMVLEFPKYFLGGDLESQPSHWQGSRHNLYQRSWVLELREGQGLNVAWEWRKGSLRSLWVSSPPWTWENWGEAKLTAPPTPGQYCLN